MALFNFLSNVGKSLFKGKTTAAKTEETTTVSDGPSFIEKQRANMLTLSIQSLGLEVQDLDVAVSGETATVRGTVKNQADREKLILALGNVEGISAVDEYVQVEGQTFTDEMKERSADEIINSGEVKEFSKFYTVEKGDTLGKIAKAFYGNAMKYPVIFEANKPMLTDPDKIYPGQVLRIPAEDMA